MALWFQYLRSGSGTRFRDGWERTQEMQAIWLALLGAMRTVQSEDAKQT